MLQAEKTFHALPQGVGRLQGGGAVNAHFGRICASSAAS